MQLCGSQSMSRYPTFYSDCVTGWRPHLPFCDATIHLFDYESHEALTATGMTGRVRRMMRFALEVMMSRVPRQPKPLEEEAAKSSLVNGLHLRPDEHIFLILNEQVILLILGAPL